jgi:hypothetical protein
MLIWERAKESVGKKGDDYPWPIVMNVFKAMVKERTSKHQKPAPKKKR